MLEEVRYLGAPTVRCLAGFTIEPLAAFYNRYIASMLPQKNHSFKAGKHDIVSLYLLVLHGSGETEF